MSWLVAKYACTQKYIYASTFEIKTTGYEDEYPVPVKYPQMS